MKRAIIHCGMPKTGSSSIQQNLASIETSDILYAQLGDPNHGEPIVNMFHPEPETYSFNRKVGNSRPDISGKRDELLLRFADALKKDQKTVIISAEVLCSIPETALRAFHEFVLSHGRTPQYCAYVRDPIGFATSHYQQKLKAGGLDLPRKTLSYKGSFKTFSTLPNCNGIDVWPFLPTQFPSGSVVQDFISRLKLDLEITEKARANESLSIIAAKLIYTFNRTFPVTSGDPVLTKARGKFVNTISNRFKGKKFKLPDNIFTEDTINWNGLIYLRKNFGIDFEDDVRAKVARNSNKMTTENFDTWMTSFSVSHQALLRKVIERHEIICPANDDIEKMLARLYLHFVQIVAKSG